MVQEDWNIGSVSPDGWDDDTDIVGEGAASNAPVESGRGSTGMRVEVLSAAGETADKSKWDRCIEAVRRGSSSRGHQENFQTGDDLMELVRRVKPSASGRPSERRRHSGVFQIGRTIQEFFESETVREPQGSSWPARPSAQRSTPTREDLGGESPLKEKTKEQMKIKGRTRCECRKLEALEIDALKV